MEAMKQIPKNLEHIFGRSYSKEDSLQEVKTYQDLLKIEDQNTFIEKAFHQVKKDFGYEDLAIKLQMVDKPIGEEGDVLKGIAELIIFCTVSIRCRYDYFVLLCRSVYTPSQNNLGS